MVSPRRCKVGHCMALRLHRRALLWHRLVRRRRAAARVGAGTRSDRSAWSARLGDSSESTARLSGCTARHSSAAAGQSTDMTITTALAQRSTATALAAPLRFASRQPRFAPRRHSTGATRTATAWTGYAPQGRCSESQWLCSAKHGTATAKVRGAMRCQGIARLSWRRRTPQRMSIARLGWGRA